MYDLLAGMRVVEAASFIAAPSAALHLRQLGAEVIRIETLGGGPDRHRWPRAPKSGASLYWEGLNKGKKSVVVDLARREGRELAQRIATAPGADAGLFVTNFPADGFLSHERLSALRPDLITLRITGLSDGGSSMDYAVNAAFGIPQMTGPATLGEAPVNAVLPTWDLLAGSQGALAMLAAERSRRAGGGGREIRLSLADLALATLGQVGMVAEAVAVGADRPRIGNDLFGAFGRDFVTRDGRRIMLVAITPRQWQTLVEALGIGEAVAGLERDLRVSFTTDEGLRFSHRERLNPIVETAVASRTLDEWRTRLDAADATWAPYRGLTEALASGDRFAVVEPLAPTIRHPGSVAYPTPGAAPAFSGLQRLPPQPAPRLGEHTDAVLAQLLGMDPDEIAALHRARLIAGADYFE